FARTLFRCFRRWARCARGFVGVVAWGSSLLGLLSCFAPRSPHKTKFRPSFWPARSWRFAHPVRSHAALRLPRSRVRSRRALVAVPFLLACNRRWASAKSVSWMEGYCPVCGAWPAFAEVRGIERSRYFRCGRCSGEWQAHCLFCPYCGMTDHNELASLVPEKGGATSVIEA